MKYSQCGGLLASALLLAACSGSEPMEPLVPTTLTANSSVAIAGVVGTAVTPPPSVVIKDQNGNPIGGVAVTFQVVSGGGSVTGGTASTGADGVATVGAWTLGPVPGENVLNAVTGSLSATFTATSIAGPPASLTKTSGDNQTGAAGSAVPVAPSVTVRDASGNALPGITVTFAVTSGGGSVGGATQVTNAQGVATVGSWTLGTVPGANTLSVTSGTLAPVSFAATAIAGAAASLARNAGDNQTANAGSAVAIPPSVIVRDANGNPVPGVSVVFAVGSGGGSITGATQVTNAQGIATVGGWTLGTTPGPNTLNATAGALGTVSFAATAVVGGAASLSINGGDNQTGVAGSPVATPPSVIVRDAVGNPRPGVAVTFAVASGGGFVTGANATTNAQGVAAVGSWTLGNVGPNTLIASSSGLPPVTFTAQALSPLCTARSAHTFGTVSAGALTTTDCVFSDGTFVDYYTTTIPQAGAYLFRQGAGFDTYLLLTTSDGIAIGENDDATPSDRNSSAIKALLPAGDYLIAPGASIPGATGGYEISSTATSSDVANCEVVFVVRNVTTAQSITTSDCNLETGSNPIYADGYFIFLTAGSSVTIEMTSGTLDSFLQVRRLDGAVVAENDNISGSTKNSRVTYTATQTNYYAIFARAVPGSSTGSYSLSIQ
jgi:LysM repeat protein